MLYKVVNNTLGLNGLILALLVFGAYLCIITDFSISASQK